MWWKLSLGFIGGFFTGSWVFKTAYRIRVNEADKWLKELKAEMRKNKDS